jgi:hypothetical protein
MHRDNYMGIAYRVHLYLTVPPSLIFPIDHMKTSIYLKLVRSLPLAILGVLIMAGADTAQATTVKKWTNQSFFGSTKAEIRKALGKPDDTNEMDTYLISDSPDLMMMGIIGYENGKVASVMAVLQPKLTYKKVRDIQIKSDKVKLVSETKEGTLFKYKKPAANGPVFLVIAPPDDKTTGPFFVEAMEHPFADAKAGKPDKKDAPSAKKKSPAKPRIDLSLLDKDVFDWQMLDDAGKLKMLEKIKLMWRATGAETDENAISAEILMEKIKFPEQSMVVEQACEAAGIDPAAFQLMRKNMTKSSTGK